MTIFSGGGGRLILLTISPQVSILVSGNGTDYTLKIAAGLKYGKTLQEYFSLEPKSL